VGSTTDTGWYGRGFYFSANFYTGAAYAGGSGAVLLCKVLVGKGDFIPSAKPTHRPPPSPPSPIHNDRQAIFVSVSQWTLKPGKSHDMQGQRQDGCPRHPNFDSHISHAQHPPAAQEIVLFEPEQVLPVYRMAFSA
jgi:hypothetical protein